DIRLSAFEITDHLLKIVVDLPSIHGMAMEVVSFSEMDSAPAGLADEIAEVLNAVGAQVLSEAWSYEIEFREGDKSETFRGEIASGD
ncbi:MAG: hypothetical protein OXG11_05360, partial [Chloroflexi bacterium]|nr:hypothetical protein [Chloroflexota bacterium]